jgi:hypothetical protein
MQDKPISGIKLEINDGWMQNPCIHPVMAESKWDLNASRTGRSFQPPYRVKKRKMAALSAKWKYRHLICWQGIAHEDNSTWHKLNEKTVEND